MLDLDVVRETMSKVLKAHRFVVLGARKYTCLGSKCTWTWTAGGGYIEAIQAHDKHLSDLLIEALAELGVEK